jgi:hypothetical protein
MSLTSPIQYSAAGDLSNDVNVMIVTATDTEYRAVMAQAKPLGGQPEISFDKNLLRLSSICMATYGLNKVAIKNRSRRKGNT